MATHTIIANAGSVARRLLLVGFLLIPGGCAIYSLDTFSTDHRSSVYREFDEGAGDRYSLTDQRGFLRIEASKGQDLWREGSKRGAPLLLRPALEGNYWAETFVSADPIAAPSQPNNTQMGLFVFQDIDNWMFFGLTNHNLPQFSLVHDGLIVTTAESGSFDIVAEATSPEDFAFLLIVREGDDWEFYWKLHQDDVWNLLTTVSLSLSDHEVGIGVKTFRLDEFDTSTHYGPAKANFDFFLIGHSE